jgi:hypothetical protein
MLDAMQTAGIAAFDADIDASLGDTPLDPTHARRAIWQAALDAAPEVSDHREVMRLALEAIEERHVGALRDKALGALRAALGEKE